MTTYNAEVAYRKQLDEVKVASKLIHDRQVAAAQVASGPSPWIRRIQSLVPARAPPQAHVAPLDAETRRDPLRRDFSDGSYVIGEALVVSRDNMVLVASSCMLIAVFDALPADARGIIVSPGDLYMRVCNGLRIEAGGMLEADDLGVLFRALDLTVMIHGISYEPFSVGNGSVRILMLSYVAITIALVSKFVNNCFFLR